MKNKILQYLTLSYLFCLISCDGSKNKIFSDDVSFELRSNYDKDYGKVEIIEIGSNKFEKFKIALDDIQDFKEIDEITTYPFLILKSVNTIIYLSENKIEFEYQKQNNESVKFSKEFKNYEEFLEFEFLWKDYNWIIDFGNIYGIGNLNQGKYIKCGIKKEEVDYFYKSGKWKFWNLNRDLIAEGEFSMDSIKTTVIGVNCENTIKVSKVLQDNWKFYDAAGNTIAPSIGLIYDIENAKNMQH